MFLQTWLQPFFGLRSFLFLLPISKFNLNRFVDPGPISHWPGLNESGQWEIKKYSTPPNQNPGLYSTNDNIAFKSFHWRIKSYGFNIRFIDQPKKTPITKIITEKFLLNIFSRDWFKFSNRNAEYKKYIFWRKRWSTLSLLIFIFKKNMFIIRSDENLKRNIFNKLIFSKIWIYIFNQEKKEKKRDLNLFINVNLTKI